METLQITEFVRAEFEEMGSLMFVKLIWKDDQHNPQIIVLLPEQVKQLYEYINYHYYIPNS